MNNRSDLIVIGAGPAGLEAAIAASQAGCSVILIDSFPVMGGQYFKQSRRKVDTSSADSHLNDAQQLFSQVRSLPIDYRCETLVWGIFEGRHNGEWFVMTQDSSGSQQITTKSIILANGAYDRSIPFPGWDLPGVITAGAALTILKNQHYLPGRRILLTGSGPLQLAAAALLSEAGAEIVAVLESSLNPIPRAIPKLPAVWGQWSRMIEGLGYFRILFNSRTPYRSGWTILQCSGDDKVERATIVKLDRHRKPILESALTVSVDAVVVGYGLIPDTSLSRLVSCDMKFSSLLGGFVPKRNRFYETSRKSIYAVGDCAGIGGAALSRIEGKIAGNAAAFQLGYLSNEKFEDVLRSTARILKREQRFADLLGKLFSPDANLYQMADPETIICRCEQISLAEIRNAIAVGAQTVTDIKNLTRSGMGNCQGRTCSSIITRILAIETGRSFNDVGYSGIRPPIHPIPLADIENMPIQIDNQFAEEFISHE